MDNETRQYGAQGSEPPRPERPKQYFPDQSQNQQQYAQPAYEEQYQPQYEQPYQEPYYEPEPKGSSAGAIALGVVAALSFLAALVLFFLWRGAAAEADKPPVTETSTVTQTTTATTTSTTTKLPSIFGDRDNPTATLPPDEPAPDPSDIEREIRENARDIFDQLREGADAIQQEQ